MNQIRRIAAIAVAAALSVACTKEMDAPEGQPVSQITASLAESKTKTVLGEDGTSILWSPNDEISVFYNDIGLKFTALNSNPTECTVFASDKALVYGRTETSSEPYLYATYPYSSDNAQNGEYLTLTVPAAQTAVEGSFGRGAYPSVGRSKDTNIAFYNVCGGIRFTLCQSGIRKIVLTGNSDENIAGKVKVLFDKNGHPQVSAVISGEKSITLTAPDNGEFQTGKWYYISVLPTEFSSSGFSFEFIKRTDERERGTKTFAVSKEIKRSSFGSIENIDSGVSFKEVADFADLSAKGTANCYIVDAAGSYKFNGTVKGGSTESVGTPASAEVLWESFGTSTTPSVGDIVKNASYSDGYVRFSTPSTLNNGNAVIAVKDASGNILWSWHIWVCKDFDSDATAQVYNNNAGTMMDRNLGATSATPGDVHALGLLYQWGRKDPFLSGCQISYSSSSNQQQAASTISWPGTVSSSSSTGTIAYAVAHPTTFITHKSCNYDWYYTGSSSTDNTRWPTSGKDKGMYDPCPAGWRVPDGGSSGVWSTAFGSSSDYSNGPWDSMNKVMNFGSGNGKSSSMQLGSASTIWYSAAGTRRYEDGTLDDVGYYGQCWSCTPNGYLVYYMFFGDSGFVTPSYYHGQRAYGLSVRCLSE